MEILHIDINESTVKGEKISKYKPFTRNLFTQKNTPLELPDFAFWTISSLENVLPKVFLMGQDRKKERESV